MLRRGCEGEWEIIQKTEDSLWLWRHLSFQGICSYKPTEILEMNGVVCRLRISVTSSFQRHFPADRIRHSRPQNKRVGEEYEEVVEKVITMPKAGCCFHQIVFYDFFLHPYRTAE